MIGSAAVSTGYFCSSPCEREDAFAFSSATTLMLLLYVLCGLTVLAEDKPVKFAKKSSCATLKGKERGDQTSGYTA